MSGTAEAAWRALPADRVAAADLTGFDVLGLPVAFVHHRPLRSWPVSAFGYGATTARARVGAIGELWESLGSAALVAGAPRVRAGATGLVGVRHLSPLRLGANPGASRLLDRPAEWVQCRTVPDGRPVLVPLDHAASSPTDLGPAGPTFADPVTNGLGAGTSRDMAVAHALGEVLQRHTNSLCIRAFPPPARLALDEHLPQRAADLIRAYRSRGVAVDVFVTCDEPWGAGFYVRGAGRERITPVAVAAGEAFDVDPGAALVKAIEEYASSRARLAFCFGPLSRLDGLPDWYVRRARATSRAGQDSREVTALRAWRGRTPAELRDATAPAGGWPDRQVPFAGLAAAPGAGDRLDRLRHALRAAGCGAVAVLAGEVDGLWVAKAVVEDAVVETMSYGRTTARCALELERRGLPFVTRRPDDRATDWEPATPEHARAPGLFLSRSLLDAFVGPRYPMYREPPPHSVVFDELPGA